MSLRRALFGVLAMLSLALCASLHAADGDITQAEYDQLKKEYEDLKKQVEAATPVASPTAGVDDMLDNKYGPNATVTTKSGKLTLGGLVQVWFYSIENDNQGLFDNTPFGGGFSSNESADNDSFRLRRAEMSFTMDIHENITAYVMVDPAREATSFPTFGSNIGNNVSGDGVVYTNAGHGVANAGGGNGVITPTGFGDLGNSRNPSVRSGSGVANRSLQDAYINYHGVLPHHDVTVGQMRRRLGEEGSRDNARLDFVERAMITQLADLRDLGLQVHGDWWDSRFQYWLGVFNGAGTAFQQRQNRSDDNDEKDLVATILVRPLWRDETWGSLELGYSILYGTGGEAGSRFTGSGPVDGLNRHQTVHAMQYAWLSYKPEGPVRGWWIRGEWGLNRDRFAPGEVVANTATVNDPADFSVQGWTVSTGYRLSESIWGEDLTNARSTFLRTVLAPLEFTFRYDTMENIFLPSVVEATAPGDSVHDYDIFSSTVITAGINYYIKDHNAKLQINYNWVDEETDKDNGVRQLREVSNNSLVVNFQVGW